MENCLRCKGPRSHVVEQLMCVNCWGEYLVWRQQYIVDDLVLYKRFMEMHPPQKNLATTE
jgi:hypothetical protein